MYISLNISQPVIWLKLHSSHSGSILRKTALNLYHNSWHHTFCGMYSISHWIINPHHYLVFFLHFSLVVFLHLNVCLYMMWICVFKRNAQWSHCWSVIFSQSVDSVFDLSSQQDTCWRRKSAGHRFYSPYGHRIKLYYFMIWKNIL